jgi:hypothetical protein
MIETTSASLFRGSDVGSAQAATTPSEDGRDSSRAVLTESYDSPEAFAQGWRRLAEQGWMIAKVTERRTPGSRLKRFFGRVVSHFDVSYERLVPRALEPAAA